MIKFFTIGIWVPFLVSTIQSCSNSAEKKSVIHSADVKKVKLDIVFFGLTDNDNGNVHNEKKSSMKDTSTQIIASSQSDLVLLNEATGGPLDMLLSDVRACRVCHDELPLGANPVVRANKKAKILIIGQAPGKKVHETSIPWNDPSGDRLREWMGLKPKDFYDEEKVAIMSMGFCYPGKDKTGDLPPRKECAELWHEKILALLPNIQLTLFVGNCAQSYYLKDGYLTSL